MVRIAVVQPQVPWGAEDELSRNVEQCVHFLRQAKDEGADLVCFPEGYPGPSHGPDEDWNLSPTPVDQVRKYAADLGIWCTVSDLEKHPDVEGGYYLTLKLITDEGDVAANYRRVQPDHQYLNAYLHGGRKHVLPADDIVVVQTPFGRIGLMICSELFVPELARLQMLKGAEIILAPINGFHSDTRFNREKKWDTWRCIARARASENLTYVVANANVFKEGLTAPAMVAGPEEMILSFDHSGMEICDIDMDRLRWLRSHYYDQYCLGAPDSDAEVNIGTRPGQNHDRRPELYGPLSEPQDDAFEYDYYKRGLDAYKDSFERVKVAADPVGAEL